MDRSRGRGRYLTFFAAAEFFAIYLLRPTDGDTKLTAAIPCAFAAVMLTAAAIILRKRIELRRTAAILTAAALTAGAAAGLFLCRAELNVRRGEVRSYIGKTVAIECVVTDTLYAEDFGSAYIAGVTSVNGEKVSFPLKITCGETFSLCEKIACDAEFRDLERAEYLYGDEYLEGKGVYAAAGCASVTRLGFSKGVRYYSQRLNDAAASVCDRYAGDGADLVKALILGQRGDLSDTLKRDFRSLGVSHLLALSGMHFSVIIGSAGAVLNLFRVRRVPKYTVLLLLSVAFAFLTGFGVTVSRAALMMILFCLAKLLGRNFDSLTALSAAAIAVTAFSPSSAFNSGFQLSFSATLGIILLAPEANLAIAHITAKQSVGETRAQRVKRKAKGVAMLFPLALYVGIAATLFTLPVTAELFGSFSVLSFFFTAILSIPVTVLIYSGFALLVLSPIPFVPKIPGFLCGRTAALIKTAAGKLANEKFIVSLRYPFVPYLLAAAAVMLAVCLFIRPKKLIHLRLFLILAVSAAFAASFFCCRAITGSVTRGECAVSYLNCGASEALTLNINGRGVIIDVSTGGATGINAADALLDENAVPEPEILILTHVHGAHADTLRKYCGKSFLKEIFIPVPGSDSERKDVAEVTATAAELGLTIRTYDRKSGVITVEGAAVSMPYFGYLKRSVQPVFALSVENGGGSVLYLSPSVWEAGFNAGKAAAGSDAVFVGAHGPAPKAKLYIGADVGVFAAERSAGYVLNESETVAADGAVTVVIK